MDLADKLRKVDALIARATTEGEKQAAALAKLRLMQRVVPTPQEFRVKTDSQWRKHLFLAICAKHNVKPYRYKGQKYATTMVRVTKDFMDTILWPEYLRYVQVLDELVHDIMRDLIAKIHKVEEEDELVIAGSLPG